MSCEKNRLQNYLTVSNIQLGSVVSGTFGKSSMKIINKILKNPPGTHFDIAPLIHKSTLAKLPDLHLAVEGILTPEQAAKFKVIQHHFDDLDKRKTELEQIILSLSVLFSDEINLTITAHSTTTD